MCHFWIFCEGSNLHIFGSKRGFRDSPLNLFKGGRGVVAKGVYLCIIFLICW